RNRREDDQRVVRERILELQGGPEPFAWVSGDQRDVYPKPAGVFQLDDAGRNIGAVERKAGGGDPQIELRRLQHCVAGIQERCLDPARVGRYGYEVDANPVESAHSEHAEDRIRRNRLREAGKYRQKADPENSFISHFSLLLLVDLWTREERKMFILPRPCGASELLEKLLDDQLRRHIEQPLADARDHAADLDFAVVLYFGRGFRW